VVGKRVGGWIWCKQCIHMYVNAKMIPVETVPGMGGKGGWEREVEGEFKYDIFDTYKNLCKCTTIKKSKFLQICLKIIVNPIKIPARF
jgi:hypothetical protein